MKKEKRRLLSLLILLILALIAMNYHYFDSYINGKFIESPKETAQVLRIIDGDTIEINWSGKKETVRLLGINTPEKGEPFYIEAKNFLNSTLIGKEILLELGRDDRDRYDRLLRYVIYDGENINEKIISEGYANYYFPSGYDLYSYKLIQAWDKCVKEEKNFCKKSDDVCSECIKLKELDIENQEIILENVCTQECDLSSWSIKDEGRKKFIFEDFVLAQKERVKIKVGKGEDTYNNLIWVRDDYVFNEEHDTLFLRDENNDLVLYYRY